MMDAKQIIFGPFRFDESNECLWRGCQAIPLRPKAFAVLKYLIERKGTLVTKQQLLEDVWPETFVGDAVLKDCIRQLRHALDDRPKSPQFIETSHRRGYRFIAPLAESTAHRNVNEAVTSVTPTPAQSRPLPKAPLASTKILGREPSLAQMQECLDLAVAGDSQILFVTGEAGIGKTTLVEAFLQQIGSNICVLRGQCLEQYGSGEAYLPILDALSRLDVERDSQIIEILRQYAPTWIFQIPRFTTVSEREALKENILGITRERMLREIAEAIEIMTAAIPVVLFLEDLHWSDFSTLDLVSYLARRRKGARLLLIGTYRPVEVIVSEHPLRGVKQELQIHRLCHELPLEYLTLESVSDFLQLTFPGHQFPVAFTEMIHQRTEGNPLFMVNVVEYLIDEKIVVNHDGFWKLQVDLSEVELGVPENIRQMIDKHIERLDREEQHILEGASVVGMECSAIAISAGLTEDVVRIEEICDCLARKHAFLLPAYLAELPDGTITPRYRFIHALYLDVLYKRVALTRRRQIHGRIGERGETIYGDRVREIAAELAVHFEQSQDFVRAVKYLLMAAENATRRSADHEAVALSRRGLELLRILPDSPEHDNQELNLRSIISNSGARLANSAK
jgi:predicted ATPase/DNA-binding winged helix-turn-helix (wHTH) protein